MELEKPSQDNFPDGGLFDPDSDSDSSEETPCIIIPSGPKITRAGRKIQLPARYQD